MCDLSIHITICIGLSNFGNHDAFQSFPFLMILIPLPISLFDGLKNTIIFSFSESKICCLWHHFVSLPPNVWSSHCQSHFLFWSFCSLLLFPTFHYFFRLSHHLWNEITVVFDVRDENAFQHNLPRLFHPLSINCSPTKIWFTSNFLRHFDRMFWSSQQCCQ